ncbi:MAG: DsrE family protein [Gammaproteobacteria bacterium]
MTQKVLFFLLVICFGLLLYSYSGKWLDEAQPVPAVAGSEQDTGQRLLPVPNRSHYVADISVHTEGELTVLFDRIEELLERPRNDQESALVSLVLHGPEVEYFALKNYAKYKSLVDRAAKLDALGAVDISICQTMMQNYGVSSDEVPAFLEQVPYGPDEVQRLVNEGYLKM